MVVSLEPCPSCFRHVRADNTVCPFCSTTFPEEFHRRLAPVAPPRGRRIENYTFRALGYVTIAASVMAGLTLSDCSASVGMTFYGGSPDQIVVTPPRGLVLPSGVKIDGSCGGIYYFDDCEGYVFCDDGVWEYTDTDPTTFGLDYTAIDSSFDSGCTFASDGYSASYNTDISATSASSGSTSVSSTSSASSDLDAGSDAGSNTDASSAADADASP